MSQPCNKYEQITRSYLLSVNEYSDNCIIFSLIGYNIQHPYSRCCSVADGVACQVGCLNVRRPKDLDRCCDFKIEVRSSKL